MSGGFAQNLGCATHRTAVEAMFDPARPTPAFAQRLRGSGAVPGHPFGLDLADGDRVALVAYLQAL
jgi:hypothetical protein